MRSVAFGCALGLVLGAVGCSSSPPGADPAPPDTDSGQTCPDGTCGAPDSDDAGGGGGGEVDAGFDAGPQCGVGFPEMCAVGEACRTSDDCVSTCTDGVCAAPSDADGKKNQDETDVDCGGPNAKKCGVGKACAAASDCGLNHCLESACAVPSPTDGVKNGTESDVDCGGAEQSFDGVTVPAAPKCTLTHLCAADDDCASAVCADNKRCVEGPSCRPLHGGYTCGIGEEGQPGAVHESCCKVLPVPGVTVTQGGVAKQVYLEKYEITAGRIRAWIEDIKAQYGGQPKIQTWVKARMAVDPLLAAMFPGSEADFLPDQNTNQMRILTYGAQSGSFDFGLLSQLGPTSYLRGVLGRGGTSGCAMYDGAYGHRTYWFDKAEATYFGELVRDAGYKDLLDEKSMNCVTPLMFTAFCAWDGGYLQSQAAISTAYGPDKWPWGDLPEPTDEAAKIDNYNHGTSGFGNNKDPRYLWPIVNYGTFAQDLTPIIAPPGRFPGDASQVRPASDTWMDLGGNMIEWSQVGGKWKGWTGASFEGHLYPRAWTGNINHIDKYGKGGARCMRLGAPL